MSPELIKWLMIGIPILIALIIVGFVVWLIIYSTKEGRKNKKLVSGFIYIHPDHGGGYEQRFQDKNLTKPDLRPVWHKEHWYSSEFPVWFFYEEKVEATKTEEIQTVLKCSCGYEAETKVQLHAHTIWNPSRRLDGKPITKEEFAKLHSKIELPVTEKKEVAPLYVLKPYDIDKETMDPVKTPFQIFDINNWDCQSLFMKTRQSGLAKALQLGAGVVMAIACLIAIIALGGELNKSDTQKQQANNNPATMVLEQNK